MRNHNHPTLAPLPEHCIRGPELSDSEAISAELRKTDVAALAAYRQGIDLLITAYDLLADLTRLEELTQTRNFQLGLLRTLERQNRHAFAAALADYDRRRAAAEDEQAQTNGAGGRPCEQQVQHGA
jgi:hypothetical protein